MKFAISGVLAALVSCVLVLGACGGDSPSSPATSEASPPPLAELSALANHFRAEEAWFMRMPESQLFALLEGDDLSDPGPSPTALVYEVLMRGEVSGPDGETRHWTVAYEYSLADQSGISATAMVERPEIPGRIWTPLPL